MRLYTHAPGRFAALSLLLAFAWTAMEASGAGLIGADFKGNLYNVNEGTGAVSNLKSTGLGNIYGIAYSPSGTLYALGTPCNTGNCLASLYTLSPTVGVATLVGGLTFKDVLEGDLAFDPTTGSLYGLYNVAGQNEYLFSINPSTGFGANIGVIGNPETNDPSAMAFDSAGNLWVVDTETSALLKVNKSTGTVISSVNLTIAGLGVTAGMAIDPVTGIAYLATGSGGAGASTNSLYTINLSTGALTLVGPLTGASVGLSGLAFPPLTAPILSITKSHSGDFVLGQANAQYTVSVSNQGEPTTGAVTLTDTIPAGLTLVSMAGSAWSCSSNACTRSDVLATGASYPPITVTVNVASNAPSQVTNQVTASGGGSATATASDVTNIDGPMCTYSFSNSPANVGSGTSTGSATLMTSLTNCPYTSVVSNNPGWIAITSGSTGSGSGSIGYSITTANTSGGQRTGSFTVFSTVSNVNLAVATFTIIQAPASCSSLTLSPIQFTFGQAGGSGTVNFSTSPCAWSITGAPSWITLPVTSGSAASFSFTVAANPSGAGTRLAALVINSGALTVAIKQTGLVCTYTITDAESGFGPSRSFTSSGGGGGINIGTPSGCSWTATSSQPFITISGDASGSGSGSVGYSVASNSSSTASQAGTIAIEGLLYAINQQPVGAPAYTCSATSTPTTVRPEGFAEKVGDVVLSCGGQAPPGGLTGDIRIGFNTAITNLLLSSGQTDALLLEDEPTSANLTLGTNVFRGILSPASGSSVILFPAVQLASPAGGTFLHTWRITNARVNAQALGAAGSVQATISITATAPFSVTSQPTVATISSPSSFSVAASSAGAAAGQTIQPVSFTEGFATAFEPRLATGQDPSSPGTVYYAESGFVNSAKLGTQTGFATNGTRLIASIGNVPAGVSVYAPASPAAGANAQVVSADATGTGGFLVPGTTEFNGIFYLPVSLTAGAGTATWEVTASNSASIETLTFNLLLVNPNGVSLNGITYAGALAPVSSGPAAQLPSTALPVPRFTSSSLSVPSAATVSLSVSPQAVTQTQTLGESPESAPETTLKAALRAETTPSNSVVGGTVTWTQVQANTGSASSSAAPNVSVGGSLPPTWVITSCTPVDSGGVCPTIDLNNPSSSYTVTYPSLDPGQTGTVMLTAQSSSQTSGAVEYSSTINSDLGNTDSTGDSFTVNFPVAEIGLVVSLTNATNFTQGQTAAQYSAIVTNGGSLPTSLPVTVTESLPMGLTLVSMAGTGWTCTLSTSSCTRSDVLGPNTAYQAITITVNVASNAPSTVTNQVLATTGVLQATGLDATNINAGTGVPATFFNGQVSLGSNVYYLQFTDGNLFGYYNLASFPIFYHYDMGFEGFVDGGNGAAFLYDFTSGHWWYTNSSLFPSLYDFTLSNWLYYLPATNNPGHYTSNPRYFSDLTTGKIITM